MGKKYFVTADIHGFYDEFISALYTAGFDIGNPDHVLISLGDALDRGKQPKEVLEFIMALPSSRRICIMGNHELLMEHLLKRGHATAYDKTNGTIDSVLKLTGEYVVTPVALQKMRINHLWMQYYHSCQFYAEIGDYIFTHGWIPTEERFDKWGNFMTSDKYDPNWREASSRSWEEATWSNGMLLWKKGVREPGKTIFCGHWHVSWGHAVLHGDGVEFPDEEGEIVHFTPFIDEGIVALDACTAYSHQVNIFTFSID